MSNPIHPKLSPFDWWRIGASVMFLVFGLFFTGRFVIGRLQGSVRPWSELLLGVLILLYAGYRLWSVVRYLKSLQQSENEPS